ncbi:MAG: helicase-exonuclease AddAB subunit AddA [Clostridia bacterium]|nr:helicase-exonuclease AddAB subunit AddA [Clostridia bacterium]
MAFNPTPMQQKAIDTRGNVLVSAAAGSGKTAVLVERVITMLTDKESPVSADRLLIVTFTNAAAAEMRSRIEKRLYEKIQENPDDADLQRQKYLLQNADICTIDSFCIKLVRENFEKCGIEPDFKISDGSQQTETCKRVMSKLIAEYLEEPSNDFYRLLEFAGCEYDEKNLTELINRIYLYSQQLPFPHNFINGLSLPYECGFKKGNVWYDMALDIANKRVALAIKSSQKMLDVSQYINKNSDKHIAYAEKVNDMLQKLSDIILLDDWDKINELLNTIAFDRMPSSEKDDENAEIFKNNQKQIKSIISELCGLFYASSKEIEADIKENLSAIKLLQELVTKYGEQLFAAFVEENAFTFYNMEQLALELLCEYKDGKIVIRDEAKKLCERYDEVLVDEFQDVNDLQNTLFYALSNREKNLFVVGDVKQSIYGFRGSNPNNFLDKKNNYVSIENADENDSKKIILSDNFRSRKGVCDAVNFFFSCLMAGQCGKVVYNEEEKLNSGGTFAPSDAVTSEILVVDKFDDDSDESLLETEAKKIAEYIISVMNEGAVISDGMQLRTARYSDFAILLDKVKDKATVIAEILASYGIPVSLGGDSFLESMEISTVMSFLQVIDNPKCDVELLAVMMSPVFAFSADEMAIIRTKQKYGPLYSAVVASSNAGDKKCADFIEKLNALRRDAVVLPVDRLISKMIHSTDILNMMSARDGKVRRANLFALIDYAKGFATRFDSGVYGFIKYIKSLPENSFKGVNVGGENSVRIMSMHNSKGLQFPVCILANLSSQINNADSISRVLFSETAGIAFKYYDEKIGSDIEMLGHAVMADAARIKTVEEKLRLLYVAMTRAIDRLCLVCSVKNLDDKLVKLSSSLLSEPPYISREFLEKGRNMGDWILSCALVSSGGETLRKYADVNVKAVESDANIKLTILKGDDENIQSTEETLTEDVVFNQQFVEKIKSNTEYVYPYEKLRFLQSKASVSRLVHSAEDDRFAFSEKPAFMMGDRLAGAARGTAMHHIMQFIDMKPDVDVKSEIERLIEWKFITEQEAASADLIAIENFFKSKVYSRIMSAKEFRREMRFLTEIEAKRIDPTLDIEVNDANIIVQGAVDLCFVEDDGVVVLDFKTDRVKNLSELVDCYGEQLDIYSVAAEKIFAKPVKEKIIYSFHLGESISF